MRGLSFLALAVLIVCGFYLAVQGGQLILGLALVIVAAIFVQVINRDRE